MKPRERTMSQTGGYRGPLEPAGPCQWRIPKSYRPDMRVDGIIFADDVLIEQIKKDQGPEQVANVATLPGIQGASLAMPDIHWGYGFCIGGVAATDPEEGGVISPGGVGYDINCGVRLLRSDLEWSEARDRIKPLVDQLFRDIPTGVGQSGKYLFDKPKMVRLMEQGSAFVVRQGWGTERDIHYTEAGGRLDGADPSRVSDRAIQRGYDQCGTLGFGKPWQELGLELVYDVAHNIAKFEEHTVAPGESKQVCVHRKGATRAFPPGHPEIPPAYAAIGQPVIIPGSMGTASWVLVGQPGSMAQSFGTTCHGAGRMMSRTAAVKLAARRRIDKELEGLGILARARGHKGLAEVQPAACKDVDHVVDVVDKVGISKKVARLRPVGVIKG